MEALQAGFKAYGVPFQIDGSVIRFDWGDEPIDRKFTYRPDRGMLSLKGDTDTSGMVPRQQGLCNAYSCKRDTRLLLVSR